MRAINTFNIAYSCAFIFLSRSRRGFNWWNPTACLNRPKVGHPKFALKFTNRFKLLCLSVNFSGQPKTMVFDAIESGE